MDWYFYVIIGVVVVLAFVFLWKYRWFKKIVYDFVVKAERDFIGSKRGNEKFSYVSSVIYGYIPLGLRWFFTVERIGKIIEWGVSRMKKELEKGLEK